MTGSLNRGGAGQRVAAQRRCRDGRSFEAFSNEGGRGVVRQLSTARMKPGVEAATALIGGPPSGSGGASSDDDGWSERYLRA